MTTPPLIVGILSCGKYTDDRQAAVRDTWLQDLKEAGILATFIVGGASVTKYDSDADTLYVPCPDDMASLSLKVKHFTRWALDQFSWKRLFKCDDDTFVHAGRLLAMVNEAIEAGHEYVGKYPLERPSSYRYGSGGAGYLLSRAAAEIVAENLRDTVWHEDLTVGKILSNYKVPFHEDTRLNAWRHNFPAPGNDSITCHHISPETMCELHEALFPSADAAPGN